MAAAALAEDFVTLVCPPGAQSAPISHGDKGYEAYRADRRDPSLAWLVDCPRSVADWFCGPGSSCSTRRRRGDGFVPLLVARRHECSPVGRRAWTPGRFRPDRGSHTASVRPVERIR
jgi:hypothetical protein